MAGRRPHASCWVSKAARAPSSIIATCRSIAMTTSVEVEKPRPGIEEVFADVGLLIFSFAYAGRRGCDTPLSFLLQMRERAPQADLILTWGKEGAYGLDRRGTMHHSPAYPPAEVKDTLGAGETFNAGLIDAYLKGLELAEALPHACRLAGKKCGQIGFDQLGGAESEKH